MIGGDRFRFYSSHERGVYCFFFIYFFSMSPLSLSMVQVSEIMHAEKVNNAK